jgi:hypothetical protein
MINILLYFVEILSEITAIIFFVKVNFNKIKITNFNILLFFLISFLLYMINGDYGILKLLISFFLICLLYYFFIDKNYKKAIINSLIFCLIVLLVDIIISIFATFILGKYLITNLLEKYYKIIFTLIENIIFLLFCFIPETNKKINKLIDKISDQNKEFYYLFLYGIIYISTCILLYNVILKELPLFYFLLLLFSCTFILIYSQIEIYKLKEKDKQNEAILKLNTFYGNLLEEDKIFKHNINNKLLTIKSIGNSKVKKLVDEYLNEEPTSARETNNLYNVPNSIKGIICEKVYHFKWTKIVVNNQLKTDPYKNIDLNIYRKLCEIISISLDNAIEATEQLKNGYIFLNFYCEKDNNIIEIINNFDEKLDVDKLGNKNYSTKNRGSGYGIYSVLKYKKVMTKYIINNNNFITKIEIKKPKVR